MWNYSDKGKNCNVKVVHFNLHTSTRKLLRVQNQDLKKDIRLNIGLHDDHNDICITLQAGTLFHEPCFNVEADGVVQPVI